MKKTILLIISLIYITSVFAQDSGLAAYVLHFTDKGIDKNAAINPSIYFTEKVVERRLKQKIPFDQTDLPVNAQYIEDVSKTGARVITRSRWFNNVVVEANADMINKIALLPYISKIQPLGNIVKNQESSSSAVKPFFEGEYITPRINGTTKQGTADLYNYGEAYNQIDQIKGQYLHNLGYSGQGMTIAVIDAGFNSVDKMSCFDSLRANNQIKGTRDFASPENDDVYSTSMSSHGTSVLSCMAANSSGQMVGTAPKADYWLLRSEVSATENIIEEYYWVSAAEFAESVEADLINSSLGYTTFPDEPASNHTYADMDGNTTVITKGADMAAKKGILVVNSAGNDGASAWKYIGAPADGDSVFTIGAVTATGTKSDFSSVGPTSDGRIKPDVVALGSGVTIFTPTALGIQSGFGTSFSSPIICGMAACIWQASPGLSNMDIIRLIKASASQASQPDALLGWGIPDFELASATMSVPGTSLEKKLTAYPNPVIDKLTLGFPDSINGKYRVEIINLQGKVVFSEQRNEGSIRSTQITDIGYLPSGIYLIKVSDQSSIFSGKIIKI